MLCVPIFTHFQKRDHACSISAVQKIQKLLESPTTTPMVAKLCGINCKNRKITKKIVQTVTPGGYPKRPFYNVKMNEKVANLRMCLKPIRKW